MTFYLRINFKLLGVPGRANGQAPGVVCAVRYERLTPMAFLRERRCEGVRKELLTAPPGATVAAIANLWGYASLGTITGCRDDF